ncbi:MAG: FHA domain-containing protein [Myxococcota bacterium]
MSTIFKLIIEDDEGQATVYPLLDGEVSIGRKEGNTIRLMERNVSRRHARLVMEGEEVVVEDLDSYNGIRVNGERILDRLAVRERDLIEIGDYHLTLEASEDDEPGEKTDATAWPSGTVPDFELPGDLLNAPTQPPALMDAEGMAAAAVTLSEEPDAPMGLGDSIPPFHSGVAPLPSAVIRRRKEAAEKAGPATEETPAPKEVKSDKAEAPIRTEPRLREQLEDGARRGPMYRGPTALSDVARLVCVSTQYAGREYSLENSPVVIGRVDENDIVIEHRSVSRQHAKISFNGRDHGILDLQSANGILINGEEYDHTKLKAGDLLELGSVQFRFVPAGARFEPTASEAREIRANGFEPPPTRSADPSAAATITDSPRSPLMPEPVTLSDRAPAMSDRAPTDPTHDRAPTERPDAATRPQADLETALTRVDQSLLTTKDVENRVRPTLAAAASPRAGSLVGDALGPVPGRGAPDYVAEPSRSVPRGSVDHRRAMYVIIGTLVVIVGLLVGLLFQRNGDEGLDRKLQELYNQGNYQGAIAFFGSNEGNFADERAAYKLAVLAEDRLEATVDPELPEAPSPALAEETGEALEVPASAARDRGPEDGPRRRLLEGLAERASNLIVAGNFEEATRLLRRCLGANSDFAPCHRQMGILRANQDDRDRALFHYRRYVELAPDAEDADRFRQFIRDAEAEEAPQ